jgi:outer membrane protein assembly factor BamB
MPVGYTSSGAGVTADLLPLDVPNGIRGTWRLHLGFRCNGQHVTGSTVVHVDADGRFETRTDSLITEADYGSETDTTIKGRLRSDAASGTIDSYARAYDNDGTTAECTRDGIAWEAASTPRPDLARVVRYVPAPGAEVMAASDDAVFFGKDDGNTSGQVWRVDSAGHAVWKRRAGIVTDLLVDGDRLWIADAGRGEVVALDLATGKRLLSTKVAPAHFDGISTTEPLAQTADAILVATSDGVVRVDRETGTVLSRIGSGTMVTVAAGGSGVFAIQTDVDSEGHYTDGRLLRLDEATGDVLGTRQLSSPFGALAVLDDAVAVAGGQGVVELLDPATLEPRATPGVKTDGGIVAAAPGLWVTTSGAVRVLNGAAAPVERIRGMTGSLTTAPGIVWVLDDGSSGAIGLRAG